MNEKKNPVSYEEWLTNAEELLAEGQSVTQQAVMTKIGRGSATTHNKHLRRYKADAYKETPSPFLMKGLARLEKQLAEEMQKEILAIKEHSAEEIRTHQQEKDAALEDAKRAQEQAGLAKIEREKMEREYKNMERSLDSMSLRLMKAEERANTASKASEQADKRIRIIETTLVTLKAAQQDIHSSLLDQSEQLNANITDRIDALMQHLDTQDDHFAQDLIKLNDTLNEMMKKRYELTNKQLDQALSEYNQNMADTHKIISDLQNQLKINSKEIKLLQRDQSTATNNVMAMLETKSKRLKDLDNSIAKLYSQINHFFKESGDENER